MKLDKRIKKLSDIITCFSEDKYRARDYVGQMGYFSDDLMEFNDLESCIYGELASFNLDEDYPFKCNTDVIDHAYFIPESILKPKPKKKVEYRPYIIAEFCHQFPIGSVVTLRRKAYKELIYNVMFTGYRADDTGVTVLLGNAGYDLENLFNDYEWTESIVSEKFKPFGVEK